MKRQISNSIIITLTTMLVSACSSIHNDHLTNSTGNPGFCTDELGEQMSTKECNRKYYQLVSPGEKTVDVPQSIIDNVKKSNND